MPNTYTPGTKVQSMSGQAKRLASGQNTENKPAGEVGKTNPVFGSVSYKIKNITPTTFFGPLQPLVPQEQQTAARTYDYLTGRNVSYTPRGDTGVSFSQLRALADVDIVRLLIETRKDQVDARVWDIQPREKNGKRPRTSLFAGEISECLDFLRKPDRQHDFNSWSRMVLEDMFVIDAPTIYPRRTRGGEVYSFDVIDGATIFPLLDAYGRRPEAPDIAYQQIIKGIVASGYNQDQLIYFPRNPRVNRIYGCSPVEQIIMTINQILRRSISQLAYFTHGDLSDILIEAPKEWTAQQIKEWQEYWEMILAGNLFNRRHGMWVPSGASPHEIKQPDLKNSFDEWLARVASFAFSISPQWAVTQVNRSTADTAKKESAEQGLGPTLKWFKRLVDILLINMGHPDLEMVWNENTEIEPVTKAEIDRDDVKAGIISINESRKNKGLDAMEGGAYDQLMVYTANGYVPVDPEKEQELAERSSSASQPPSDDKNNNDDKSSTKENDASEGSSEGDMDKRAPQTIKIEQPGTDEPIPSAAMAEIQKIYAAALKKQKKESLARNSDGTSLTDIIFSDPMDFLVAAAAKIEDDLSAVTYSVASGTFTKVMGAENQIAMDNMLSSSKVSAQHRVEGLASLLVKNTRSMITKELSSVSVNESDISAIRAAFIADAGNIFTDARAKVIASYETALAKSQGFLLGANVASLAGAIIKKVWNDKETACPTCAENGLSEPILLNSSFPSGDSVPPAHPSCVCTLSLIISREKADISI